MSWFLKDTNEDVLNFYCKYETLCFCSLNESIAMMKQPFG